MDKKLKIGLVQCSPVWEDKSASKGKLRNLLDQISGLDLIIFPEISLSHKFPS